MKYILALAVAFFSVTVGMSQIIEPVEWTTSVNDLGDDNFEIVFMAEIDPGWSIYSQHIDEGGPIPTSFNFENVGDGYELIGKTEEGTPVEKFDKIFEMDMAFFFEHATFKQKIKRTNPSLTTVNVYLEYQTCDDEKCIFADENFEIPLVGGSTKNTANLDVTDIDKAKTEALIIEVKGELEEKEKKGYWAIFLLGFIGGLLALMTPCVFPMIPLTVSFFIKGSKSKGKGLRNAILYGFFIFLIYVLLSLPFHLLDTIDEGILNNISTNVWLNILFFAVFLVFAFSFFGYFELTLPSSWSSKMDEKATKIGGGIGIFFMALTLAIVSFSCTGPILGGLLGGSLSQDAAAMELTFGMGGFGFALALPFALFALFPNMLNSLPKSGGWLNTVKVVLGFAELALAFKFLSNADLVMHAGILKREIFIGIWILCALGMALYLFGFIRFPHDGPKKRPIPKGNLFVGILATAFAIYMIPGLTNTKYNNLKLLSGLAPPLSYSLYEQPVSPLAQLTIYKDFSKGVEAAKVANKPIMIDFTGWACVNCRKMEEHVWTDPEVFKVIKDEFILISLYVDDREKLPEEDQFTFLKPTGGTKKIRTVGDLWGTFQTVNFKNNSQPFYVLMNDNYELLNKPTAYTPNISEYLAWLKDGLANFK